MRPVLLLLALPLMACAPKTLSDPALEAETVALTPTANMVAASTVFNKCLDKKGGIYCFACQVSLRDGGDGRIYAGAAHYRHAFTRQDARYKLVSSGALEQQKYVGKDRSLVTAKAIYKAAEKWCAKRAEGKYYSLKNDITKVFGGET